MTKCTVGDRRVWAFGYGSLMWDGWEARLSCLDKLVATLPGYRRAFNKLSQRNWGTKAAPCPTLNLQADPTATCRGMAFAFPAASKDELLAVRQGHRRNRRSRLIARGQHRSLDLCVMDSARDSIGMHRCPPILRWTPSSGTLGCEARWGRRTLTVDAVDRSLIFAPLPLALRC